MSQPPPFDYPHSVTLALYSAYCLTAVCILLWIILDGACLRGRMKMSDMRKRRRTRRRMTRRGHKGSFEFLFMSFAAPVPSPPPPAIPHSHSISGFVVSLPKFLCLRPLLMTLVFSVRRDREVERDGGEKNLGRKHGVSVSELWI